jgi:hypothetical protein
VLVPKIKASTEWILRDGPHGINSSWRMQNQSSLLDNEKWGDIKLRPSIMIQRDDGEDDGKEYYHAQKAFLASWSPVFDSIFYGDCPAQFKDAAGSVENGELIIESVKEILYLFLQLIHTGEIVLTIETVWPFYCFVNTYQVNQVIDSVEDIVDKAVSVDTCCSLLCSAQQLGSYDHYSLRK